MAVAEEISRTNILPESAMARLNNIWPLCTKKTQGSSRMQLYFFGTSISDGPVGWCRSLSAGCFAAIFPDVLGQGTIGRGGYARVSC